jgi:TonB-dependent SusC/RagA subfamily outer membrane receptor
VPALIVVDGIKFDGKMDDISVFDVEAIDIFKDGAALVLFGSNGAANGVISITTRRGGNIPIIDHPNKKTSAPLGYQKPVEFYAPKYDTPESKNFAIPDYRTTIYWEPDLIVSDDGKATFEFYTSDFPTTYSIVIEGISTNGRIIRHVEKRTINP